MIEYYFSFLIFTFLVPCSESQEFVLYCCCTLNCAAVYYMVLFIHRFSRPVSG